MTALLNILSNKTLIFIIGLVLNLVVYGFLFLQKSTLENENNELKNEVLTKQNRISELEYIVENQDKAINELQINQNKKDNLNKELKNIRLKITQKKDNSHEASINKPLRDSVDFINSRLRAKNKDN